MSCGDGKTNNPVGVLEKLRGSYSVGFLKGAAFVGGLMNARNRLVLFGEHDR